MDMDFMKMLQWYAAICLFSVPIEAGLFAYLYKKTGFVTKLNDGIDRMLKLPPIPHDAEEKDTNTEAGEPVDEPDQKNNTQQVQPKTAVASLRLRIGDIYYCRLSSAEHDERRYNLFWFSRNEFVGKMDENAVFSAEKTGTTLVAFKIVGDAMDKGKDLYEINVIPSNPDWFAETLLQAMDEGTKRDVLLPKLIDKRILSEDTEKNIITLEGNDKYRSMKIQFTPDGTVERVLYELKNIRRNNEPDIQDELKERFEQVRLSGEGISIWVRRLENDERDEVRQFAIIREYPDGKRYFGMSRFWRALGEYEEFELNISLAEKIFSDLLPDKETAKVKPFRRRQAPRRPAPVKQLLAQNNEEPIPSLPAQEQTNSQTEKEYIREEPSQPSESEVLPVEQGRDVPEGDGLEKPAENIPAAAGQPDEEIMTSEINISIDDIPDTVEDGTDDHADGKETGEVDFEQEGTSEILDQE